MSTQHCTILPLTTKQTVQTSTRNPKNLIIQTATKDSISRTDGTAKAHRDKKWPEQPANVKPAWPWSQDQTELGTADFRSIKFCIYEASLVARDGSGVRVEANADAHFRACITDQGVSMNILSQCPLAQVVLKPGTRLMGEFSVRLMAKVR